MTISSASRKRYLPGPIAPEDWSELWWLEITVSCQPDIMVVHRALDPAWKDIVRELLAPLSPEALMTLDQEVVSRFTPKGMQSFTLDGTVVTVQHFI